MVQRLDRDGLVLQAISRKDEIIAIGMRFIVMMNITIKLYEMLIKLGRFAVPFALLLIRLGWGWELLESGYGHLTHIQKTTEFFESLHIPMAHANVIISGGTELVGGALFMIGLGSRMIAIPLLFNFCVAYLTASRDTLTGLLHNDFSKFVDDSAFPFLATSLLIFAFGPGMFSIDGILARIVFKSASMDARRGFPVIQ